jgi:hypothetical protein
MESNRVVTLNNAGESQKEVDFDLLETEPYIEAKDYINYIEKNKKNVKFVVNESKIEDLKKIYDVSLKGRGATEDKIFMENPSIQKNVRRGNSLLEFTDGSIVMGRKGLMKFYDLYDYYLTDDKKQQKLTNERIYTMGPIAKACKKEGAVTIYKTLKANGENAQISYCS